ncbi:hypothetical protein F2Q70_00001805 [Brassica cretica]|uniref:Uncharacterized protein n=1 Tax=Brassica cretica TaxID=69181 RepID=A0A8S9ISG2_BRACR|nr:hypothetical protein F2Q70_00001805 [Brassica cretica]KAF3563222.1 hypothetical protein DY000_02012956 [Brassica cretica]
MKRNQGSEDLDSEKKPLLQSLHLPNVLPGTFLIISFIGTTADKHREDHKPQEQP